LDEKSEKDNIKKYVTGEVRAIATVEVSWPNTRSNIEVA